MDALGRPDWLVALMVFLAVALGVLSLVLLIEGIRGWRRRRAVRQGLRRLRDRGREDGKADRESLLREPERQEPEWIRTLQAVVPRGRDLDHLLRQADSDLGVGSFVLLTLGLAAGLGLASLILFGGWLLPLVGAVFGGAIPYAWVARKRSRRYRQFEEHLPDAIDLLSRSLRAGHAFPSGLGLVAEESQPPVSNEFRQVFEEQKFGLPLRETLLGLADRVDTVDVRMFVTAVLIQREAGGNLAENLDKLGRLIRERFKFRRQLRIHTAQGRMSGYILAALPVGMGLVIYALNPEYLGTLFEEPLGRGMLMGAAGLQVVGYFSIRRIIDVEL